MLRAWRVSRASLILVALALLAGAARADGAYDVVIVGGGPGGLTAAAKLAGQGHRVLVIEKRAAKRLRPQIVGVKDVAGRTLAEVGAGLRPEESSRYLPHNHHELAPYPPAPPAETDPIGHMSRVMGEHTIAINHLEERLYAANAGSPNIDVVTLSSATEAPRYDDRTGTVHLTVAGRDGAARRVEARYLVVSDGAGSETLKRLGVKTRTFAKATLAAAFWKQKGRHIIMGGDGVGRLGDGVSTYTLNALTPEQAAGGPDAVKAAVIERGKAVGIKKGDPIKAWTFDTVMQKPDSVLLMDGHAFVIGDAAGTPHPFTAMGVNKAIVEGADAADTIHQMMSTGDEGARQRLGQRWATRTQKGVAELHAAGLPYYEKYGAVLKTPTYAIKAQRKMDARTAARARR